MTCRFCVSRSGTSRSGALRNGPRSGSGWPGSGAHDLGVARADGVGPAQRRTVTPASAQLAGADEFQTMEQFAPVLEVMKQHMGKKRFGQLMQTVGPMMDQMMAGEGSSAAGGYGAFGGSHSFDVGRMVTLIDG